MSSRFFAFILIFMLGIMPATQLLAQNTEPSINLPVVNIPYINYYGLGAFRVGENRVAVLQIRVSPGLQSYENNRFGLKLRLAAWTTVLNFKLTQETPAENFFQVAFVPGIEALFPVFKRRALVRPFFDVGFIRDYEFKSNAMLVGMGVVTEFIMPWRRFEIGIEPLAGYSFSNSREELLEDGLTVLGLKLDLRHALGFRLFGNVADGGVFINGNLLWGDNVPNLGLDETFNFDRQLEVGVSFGTNPRKKIVVVRLPRLSIGYRFGKDFRGIRISFGDRNLRLSPNR